MRRFKSCLVTSVVSITLPVPIGALERVGINTMKWFKHDTDARNDTRIKLLKKKFGAMGYGIYFQLLEIIGENIKDNNHEEWGFVEEIHTLDTLADECGVSRDKLTTVLAYCNELGLLYKLDHKMCCPKILLRLDEYATRRKNDLNVYQREKELTKQCRESIGIVSGQNRVLEQNRIEQNRIEKKREEYHTLSTLTEKEFELVATDYNVPIAFVRSVYDDMCNYCASKGKTYKDYLATLRNWVKRDAIKLAQEGGKRDKYAAIDASNL